MFDFFKRVDTGEDPFQPCIGEIDTYDMAEARALVKRRHRELLMAVCADDIGRVEQALTSGDKKFGIYIRYSVGREFFRKHPGFHGSVDFSRDWNGVNGYYSAKEVRSALANMKPNMIRPASLSEYDNDRILAESGNVCWLCSRCVPDGLSVQELMPWERPYMVIHDKCREPYREHMSERDMIMCKPMCGDCLRAWRRVFESKVRSSASDWGNEQGIPRFDILVQGGCGSDEELEPFQQACRWSIGV